MSGKKIATPFSVIFGKQTIFQKKLSDPGQILPEDNVGMFQYHVTAMQEEMGELLKADKRWKTHRNKFYNPDEKLDELADCYITLINITLWSGYSLDDMLKSIDNKVEKNNIRLEKER